MTSFNNPNYGIGEVQSMTRNNNIDRVPETKPASRYLPTSTNDCSTISCRELGQYKPDCIQTQGKHSSKHQWCFRHLLTTRNDAECNDQKRKANRTSTPCGDSSQRTHGDQISPNGQRNFFGYAFASASWRLSWNEDTSIILQTGVHIDTMRKATDQTQRTFVRIPIVLRLVR